MGGIESKTSASPPAAAAAQEGGLRAGNVTFAPELLAKLQDEQKMRLAKSAAQAPVHQIPMPSLDPIAAPTSQQLERALQFKKEASERALLAAARKEAAQREDELAAQAEQVLEQIQRQLAALQASHHNAKKEKTSAQEFLTVLGAEANSPVNSVFQKMRLFESSVTS
ncbi:hypothetical protein BASA81_006608 [Batrachochytrium salamandrivorans]|nr:hypothetical protein BASA81_006608 [Batrachochytrium salamandrivorans]